MQVRAVVAAIQYFKRGQAIHQQTLQTHLNTLQSYVIEGPNRQQYLPMMRKMIGFLIENYHSLLQKQTISSLQEYLAQRYVNIIGSMVEINDNGQQNEGHLQPAVGKQELVVLLSCLLGHLKVIEGEGLLYVTLRVSESVLERLLKCMSIVEIYPQVYCTYTLLLHKARHPRELIVAVGKLIINGFRAIDKVDPSVFALQFYRRVALNLRRIHQRITRENLSLNRIESYQKFIIQIQPITHNQIECFTAKPTPVSVAKRDTLTNWILLALYLRLPLQLEQYQLRDRVHIHQICKQTAAECITILTGTNDLTLKHIHFPQLTNVLPHHTLHIPSHIALLQRIFSISIQHQLITIPPTAYPLLPLQQYSTNSSLRIPFHVQTQRVLLEVLPYFYMQMSLHQLVQDYIAKMDAVALDALLEEYSTELLKYSYVQDGEITTMFRHLSLVITIHHLIRAVNRYSCSIDIIFDTLCWSNQTTTRLLASYREEELLISLTLHTLYLAYALFNDTSMQRARRKTALYERLLSCLEDESYMVRLTTHYIIIQLCKGESISQSLIGVQSTLIHRNRNNLRMMRSLMSLTSFTPSEYEQLAHYYLTHPKSQSLLTLLIPYLSTETARKCILAVPRFPILLTPTNILHLQNAPMQPNHSLPKDIKQQRFSVTDGENVVITNALGVIVLELGDKWEGALQSGWKETVVDTLNHLDKSLVLFRGAFKRLLPGLTAILKIEDDFYERLRRKVINLLRDISQVSYGLMKGKQLDDLRRELERMHQDQSKQFLGQILSKIPNDIESMD